MKNSRKHVSLLVTALMAIIYYVVTDPDMGLVENLPYGVELMMVLNVFIIAGLCITLVEMAPVIFFDGNDQIDGDERELVRRAKQDPVGASNVYLGNSIRVVGYSIIIAMSIMVVLGQ